MPVVSKMMKRTTLTALVVGMAGSGIACSGVGPFAPPPEDDEAEVEVLRVTNITPASGSSDVPAEAAVSVTFSHPIDPQTITPATFQVSRVLDGSPVAVSGRFTISTDARTASFDPSNGLANNSVYQVVVTSGVRGATGALPGFDQEDASFTTARVTVVVEDPAGDLISGRLPPGIADPDLRAWSVQQGPEALDITLLFADPVAFGAIGPAAVGGFLDLDIDQEASTGATGAVDLFRPSDSGTTGMGVEFIVELHLSGVAVVRNVAGEMTGQIEVRRLAEEAVAFSIPYRLIGRDDGNVDTAVIVGNEREATDLAPNSGRLRVGSGAGS